jgi:hypothetical protein
MDPYRALAPEVVVQLVAIAAPGRVLRAALRQRRGRKGEDSSRVLHLEMSLVVERVTRDDRKLRPPGCQAEVEG